MKVASGRAAYRGARRGRGASRAGGREEEPVWISLRNRTLTPEPRRARARPGPGPRSRPRPILGEPAEGQTALELTEFPLERGWYRGDRPSRVGTLNLGYQLLFLLLILQFGYFENSVSWVTPTPVYP